MNDNTTTSIKHMYVRNHNNQLHTPIFKEWELEGEIITFYKQDLGVINDLDGGCKKKKEIKYKSSYK